MVDTNVKIKKEMQALQADSGLVCLYTLDARNIGGGVHYFTPGPIGGQPVVFNGTSYAPLEVKVEGMAWEGDGKMPRPTITVSNVNKVFLAEIIAYDDLVGAKLTRIRTYAKYLDGQNEADPTASFPEDVFYVERKIRMNKLVLQFELKAAVDLENVLIPKRQVLPLCNHIYRRWTGTEFDYTNVTCPYSDIDFYDETGQVTTADKDKCGQKLFDCKLRFPSANNTDDQLPGRFFPGVGQFGRPYRR